MRTTRTLPALLVALACAACTVRADVDDPTPPLIELKYHLGDGEWIEVPSSGVDLDFPTPEAGEEAPVLYLWAVGEDSGGVERVVLRGQGDRVCQSGLSKYSVSSPFDERSVASSGTGGGDRTVKFRNVTMVFDGPEACSAGTDTLKSGEITFTATARNFAGDEATSPEVRITRPRDEEI